jgi:hypothetical protein
MSRVKKMGEGEGEHEAALMMIYLYMGQVKPNRKVSIKLNVLEK